MLTPQQSRAARGWLGWTQEELAGKAAIGLSTVRDLETDRRQISETKLLAIRAALEAAGIRFVEEGGVPRGIEATASLT